MRAPLRVAGLFAVAATGCVESSALILPDDPDVRSARSLIMISAAESGERSAFAIDLEATDRVGLSLPTTYALVAVLYQRPLADLPLEPGPIVEPEVGAPFRPFPPDLVTYRAGGAERAWTRIEPPLSDPVVLSFRLPGLTSGSCEDGGGCFRRTEEGMEFCEQPCILPEPPQPPLPPDPPRAPEPVRPPRMTPCPPDWSMAQVSAGPVVCVPPDGFGTSNCTPGQWPDAALIPSSRNVVYASPSAAPGGTGTQAAPFSTMADALDAAGDGGVVALSAETFADNLVITSSVVVVGACAGGTAATVIPRIRAASSWARVTNLRIAGDFDVVAASVRTSGAVLQLDHAVVEAQGGGQAALLVQTGATLRARDVAVLDAGLGVVAESSGSRLELDRVSIDGASGTGVLIRTGARAFLGDVAVRDTGARGVHVSGAELTASRLHVSSTGSTGLDVETSTATLSDVVIEEVQALNGLFLRSESNARIDRAFVRACRHFGTTISHSLAIVADLESSDSVLNGTTNGEGLVIDGAGVELTRGRFARNHHFGIAVISSVQRAEARLTDIEIRDTTRATTEDHQGYALDVRDDVIVHLERALFEDNIGGGIRMINNPPAPAGSDYTDVTVRRSTLGTGVLLDGPGDATLRRVLVEDVRGNAVFARYGKTVVVEDGTLLRSQTSGVRWLGGAMTLRRIRVEDTQVEGVVADPIDEGVRIPAILEDVDILRAGKWGARLRQIDGEITRLRAAENIGFGVCLHSTDVTVTDLEIRDTAYHNDPELHCAPPDVPTRNAIGLLIRGRSMFELVVDGVARVTRFSVTTTEPPTELGGGPLSGNTHGVDVGPFTNVDLRNGRLESQHTGVYIRNPSPENIRFHDNVIYRFNQENFGSAL